MQAHIGLYSLFLNRGLFYVNHSKFNGSTLHIILILLLIISVIQVAVSNTL